MGEKNLDQLQPNNGHEVSQAAQGTSQKYSYSSTEIGTFQRLRELYYIARKIFHTEDIMPKWTVRSYELMKEHYTHITGEALKGKNLLDIGPGQNMRFMRCFGVENEVVGIDMDVLPETLGIKDLVDIYQKNSLTRVIKTVGRKLLGADEKFKLQLHSLLDAPVRNDLKTLVGNAEKMNFESNSFDMVYSFSVFEHLHNPQAAIREVARVLKPGGVAQICLHLYTSHSGIHDPKIFASWEAEPPFWPHLRPKHAHIVTPNSWLNKVRLKEWQRMFAAEMPGVEVRCLPQDDMRPHLAKLREDGELADYTDDELLSTNIIGLWHKP